MSGIFSAAPNDVWANATAGLFHWNGTTWTPAGLSSFKLSGTGSKDVWGISGTDALHWDGETWTRIAMPVSAAFGSNPMLALPQKVMFTGSSGRRISFNR